MKAGASGSEGIPAHFVAPGIRVEAQMVNVARGVRINCVKFSPQPGISSIPVVFVPGWFSFMLSWRTFLPVLTSKLEVIYVETREKRSAQFEGPTDFSVAAMAHDLAEVVQYFELAPNRFAFVGSSVGATLTLEAIPHLTSSPLCAALILPNSRFPLPRMTRLLRVVPATRLKVVKSAVQWFMLRFRIDPLDTGHGERFVTALDQAEPHRLKQSALAVYKYRLDWGQLRNVQFPCLVIGASKDREHRQNEVIAVANAIPKCEYLDLGSFSATHSKRAAEAVVSYVERRWKSAR